MIRLSLVTLCTALLTLLLSNPSYSQPVRDFSKQLEIPSIISITSSDTHLYVLSETEGLVVFRARPDSLQWLYTSSGMQERGHTLQSDIRFAYLFGEGRRLTIIEPTSVLGVYSSTVLPSRPVSAERIGFQLFVNMEDGSLGVLSLESPESVDEEIKLIQTGSEYIIDIASDGNNLLYSLTANNRLQQYEVSENDISLITEAEISLRTERLFLVNGTLYGSGRNGSLFTISGSGTARNIASLDSQVTNILHWNEITLIRTSGGSLWTFDGSSSHLQNWKPGDSAGNFITLSEGTVWVSEFDFLAPVTLHAAGEGSQPGGFAENSFLIRTIPDITMPFPRPFIIPIEMENGIPTENITFSYSAPFTNARIRGNTFYWQPAAAQNGRHEVTITATSSDGRSDSKSFILDLRPFNAPPQFSPARPVTIPGSEPFEFQISAFDPDGADQDLIRYLGVDLPEGAELNERTGLLRWTPSPRQTGEHTFRVIATDQFGAASSQVFEFRVIEIETDETEVF
ncbi:MAG: cadherin repeat domain-containing protein [Balneolaceae bacterium]|nr:MAG: cadherin repeat domain-containing protein [Balneolaceae bacterium]